MHGNHNHFHDNCQPKKRPERSRFYCVLQRKFGGSLPYIFLYFIEFDYLDVSHYSSFWTQKLTLIFLLGIFLLVYPLHRLLVCAPTIYDISIADL